MTSTEYHVVEYTDGKLTGIVSGCGRNKNTWDSSANSKRTAQRWAKHLREGHQKPGVTYKVEPTT